MTRQRLALPISNAALLHPPLGNSNAQCLSAIGAQVDIQSKAQDSNPALLTLRWPWVPELSAFCPRRKALY
jgi:hypothetical protein